jgi:hypothetical protein
MDTKKLIKFSIFLIFFIFKTFYLIVLLYQAIGLTIDYLKFPTIVRFEVTNDIKYFKIPLDFKIFGEVRLSCHQKFNWRIRSCYFIFEFYS